MKGNKIIIKFVKVLHFLGLQLASLDLERLDRKSSTKRENEISKMSDKEREILEELEFKVVSRNAWGKFWKDETKTFLALRKELRSLESKLVAAKLTGNSCGEFVQWVERAIPWKNLSQGEIIRVVKLSKNPYIAFNAINHLTTQFGVVIVAEIILKRFEDKVFAEHVIKKISWETIPRDLLLRALKALAKCRCRKIVELLSEKAQQMGKTELFKKYVMEGGCNTNES